MLLENLLRGLAETGYVIIPRFLKLSDTRKLIAECVARVKEGDLRPAAIGRGAGKNILPEIRTDNIHWLESHDLSESQTVYWDKMEDVRTRLNRSLFLGLIELEAHLACFAPGGYYKPHLDCHKKTQSRILSAILYLDEDWVESDGGQLRLYTDNINGVKGPSIDIFPEPGKLVIFVSAEFWHEVRKSSRFRHSLTGWFRGRELMN
ncbi:MAG: 2OG-Fe(II) oxygenase [Verrucomicrobiales bacterium]|nr:2OG-Fe(II) oxygenase [Verrucomicrobiales bacterium]